MAKRRTHRLPALEELELERRRAADRLSDLRTSIDRELGAWAPRGRGWVLPMVGFACGLALAFAGGRRRRKKSSGDDASPP